MAGKSELAPEWQQKIINTGEKGKKDSIEETAIAFVLSHKKAKMPEERLNKLISAITKILEEKNHNRDSILKECETALIHLDETIKKEGTTKEILHAKDSCILNKFDPSNINGANTLKYFECLENNPQEEQKLQRAFEQDPKLYAGFIRYALFQRRETKMSNRSNIVVLGGEKNQGITWMDKKIIEFKSKYKGIDVSALELTDKHSTGIKNIEEEIKKMNEIEKGRKDMAWVEKKISNIGSNLQAEAEILKSKFLDNWKEHKILQYDGTNTSITIGDFENNLKVLPIQDINSRGFAEYLIYISKKQPDNFNNNYFSQIIGKEKLGNLSILWNISNNTGENKSSTLAQYILAKDNSDIKTSFSTILEMSMKKRDSQIEKLKESGDVSNTKMFLEGKSLKISQEELSSLLKSGSLKDIIGGLSVRKLILKTEKDADDLFTALTKDSHEKVTKIELAQKETGIDGNETVEEIVTNYGLVRGQLSLLLKKKLNSLSKEELQLLLNQVTISKKEEKKGLTDWLNLQLEKLPVIKLSVASSSAKQSPQVKKGAVKFSQGKIIGREFEKTLNSSIDIYTKKEELKTEVQNDDELFKSALAGTKFSLEDLLNNNKKRKEYLLFIDSKEQLTPAEKKLKKVLERFEYNEQRNTIFESQGIEKLEKFDQQNPIKGKDETVTRIVPESQQNKVSRRDIPFEKIDNGKPHTITLDRGSTGSDSVTIKRDGDMYTVQIGNNTENTTQLSKEKIPAYIKSLRFMEKIGLGYFIKNIPANKLGKILKSTSSESTQVNNEDGNFDESEKIRILSSFGKILDIPGSDTLQNSKDGQKLFHGFFFTHTSIGSILTSKNILQNGSIDSDILIAQIKNFNKK